MIDRTQNQDISHRYSDHFWLPDLCNGIAFLRLILLGTFVAIGLTLLKEGVSGFQIEKTGQLFLYTVWVTMTCALGLCHIRRWGKHLSLPVSVILSIFWLGLSSTLCVLATYQLTQPFNQFQPTSGFLYIETSVSLFSLWSETTLITLIVGCLSLRFLYVHYEMQYQQRQLMQAHYDALQARIKPHFLFNSLNSIACLVGVDAEKAEDAILNLSDLLRMTLGERASHTLSDELDLCQKYLHIEKLRMAERLNVDMSINPDALSLMIPSLSLQPLLENAVLHGLQQIPEGGAIKMKIDILEREKQANRILIIEILSIQGVYRVITRR